MAESIVDVPTWTTTLTVPQDGDDANAASLKNTFVQGLANRTTLLRQPAVDLNVKYPLASRSLQRYVTTVPRPYPAASWTEIWDASGSTWESQVGAAESLLWSIEPPDGSTITAIQIVVTGGSGHSASLPTTMPKAFLIALNYAGVSNYLGIQADTSATKADFEVLHTIDLTIAAPYGVVDKQTYRYYVLFAAETGTGSRAGLLVHSARYAFTVTEQDPGAG